MRSASHQSDEWDTEDEQRRGSRKHSFQRKRESRDKGKTPGEKTEETEETEDYWFVCRRWFAKREDDGKIVRELLPTDEHGHPLDTGLEGGCWRIMMDGRESGVNNNSTCYTY